MVQLVIVFMTACTKRQTKRGNREKCTKTIPFTDTAPCARKMDKHYDAHIQARVCENGQNDNIRVENLEKTVSNIHTTPCARNDIQGL